MNNTNKTKKIGFSETTAELGSSITTLSGTTLNGATYVSNRRLSKTRCKCGGRRFVVEDIMFLTYPAQYPVECEFCGARSTAWEDDLITLTEVNVEPDSANQCNSLVTQQSDECKHTFELKLVNGKYVTYCTKCGKIGDTAVAHIDLSCKQPVVDNFDKIPCLDPLRFTCTVGENAVNQTTTSEDEIKRVKAYAGSTITTK